MKIEVRLLIRVMILMMAVLCSPALSAQAEEFPDTFSGAELMPEEHVHEYEVIEQEDVSCTEEGYVVYACFCGDTYTETLPASGHIPGDIVYENIVDLTCTEDGSHDEVICCTVCEEELSRETVSDPAAGHSWDEGVVIQAPTSHAEGSREFTCQVCGETRTETIEVLPLVTSGTCGNEDAQLTWEIDESGKLTILGSGEMQDYEPYEEGMPAPWFGSRNEIETVEIHEAATIGDYAFSGCAGLKTVMIPGSVASIGMNAFSDCTALETIIYDGTEEEWNAIDINLTGEDGTPDPDAFPGTARIRYLEDEQAAMEKEEAMEEVPEAPVLAEGLTYNETAQSLIISAEEGTWIRIASEEAAEPEALYDGPEHGTEWISVGEEISQDLMRIDAGTYHVYWYYGEDEPASDEPGNPAGQVNIAKADAVVLQAPAVNVKPEP